MSEIRPSSRAHVHHAVVYIRPPGSDWLRAAPLNQPFTASTLHDEHLRHQAHETTSDLLLVYAPGSSPDRWPEGMAKFIPAHSDLIFQMHYTTNGKPATDQTKVGFVLAKEPPKYRLLTVPVAYAYFYTGQAACYGHIALRIPGFFAGLLTGALLRDGQLRIRLTPALAAALVLLFYIPYTHGIVFYSEIVAGALAVAYVYLWREKAPAGVFAVTARYLRFFGKYSLEIFLFHQPLIRDYNYYLHGRWLAGALGGAGTVGSYVLALWAMTVAPLALVAALRETAILFATVISALVLKERITPQRLISTALIIAGAVALRFA